MVVAGMLGGDAEGSSGHGVVSVAASRCLACLVAAGRRFSVESGEAERACQRHITGVSCDSAVMDVTSLWSHRISIPVAP